ncbi:efflux RND transporter periplasmic adaptor subunit [Pararhodobacter sp. SW119]|uniref:efflux RND transporter periplasmic adaptor subunit n=1 Tax=Pararhodobacter sp. SW119 TaxID=2780075 RepID=UPI001ADFF8E5|nr:efflux RND transporter periplasmic adaptor subunit [Pararhodobacter sp. SW119]
MGAIGRILAQGFGLLAVAAIAVVIWAVWLPSSHPVLDRIGILGPLERLGLPLASDSEDAGGGPRGGFGGGGAVPVVAGEVGDVARRDRVSAIGTGAALRSVILQPEVSGRIVEIAVEPGAWVEVGTVIARLDDQAEAIARDRAALMLDEATDTAERLSRLRASGTATTVQINEAELAVRTAELAVREAEFELERRRVRAPISGWIGLIDADTGDQVAVGTQIARIDDRSVLLVEFRVPERIVGLVAPGDSLSVAPLARRDTPLEGHIRAIDSRVDAAGRNLRIQAEVDNSSDALRPGMAFAIEMEFTGASYPAVEPLAIQWSNDGAFVWMVREGLAERVDVRIVQRANGQVLISGDVAPGEHVVLEGVQSLRDGTEVELRSRGQRPADRSDSGAEASATPAPSET